MEKTPASENLAKVAYFQQVTGISDFGQLAEKIEQMSRRHYEVANAIKEKSRRIDTLNKHLEQYEFQKQTKSVHQKYQRLDPKKRGAYGENTPRKSCCIKKPPTISKP